MTGGSLSQADCCVWLAGQHGSCGTIRAHLAQLVGSHAITPHVCLYTAAILASTSAPQYARLDRSKQGVRVLQALIWVLSSVRIYAWLQTYGCD